MGRPASTPRRNGPYAPLSAHYPRDEAILTIDADEDDLAEVLFARSLAYCAADPRLDGYISDVALRAGVVLRRRRQERVLKAAEKLASVGIYVREGSGYRFRSWPKWNRTHAEIEGKRETDRQRKGGQQSPDDEPPPPEDRDGIPEDSARNPDGIPMESPRVASRACADASNATHSNATQGTSPQSSGSTLPPLLDELRQALTQAKIVVSWQTDVMTTATVLAAAQRCGVPALVRYAKAAYRPDDPAFSVKAFVAGWDALPGPSAKLELVPDPCDHGEDFRARCALCRAAS